MEVINTDHNKLVCPFRTKTTVSVAEDPSGVPNQVQLVEFPECQYILCPFYNKDGKTNNEKCMKAV